MSERVTITTADGVADVRLNRPEKMNALDPAMFSALSEAGRALAEDRAVRAVVLSGEGRAFCAGLDFQSFAAMTRIPRDRAPRDEGAAATLLRRDAGSPANAAQRAAYVWTELPVPVIAALHGVAYGGGLQIALGADLRLVAPDARLSVMEIKWGLIPDMTGAQMLRHLARIDVARELTYTGREVSGEEAVALGLATRVSNNPREDAFALAREIATKSPHAIRAAKQLFRSAWVTSPEEGLLLEERLQMALIGSPNQVEAVRANLEKREPKFSDPE
ncbi:MAG: crotonase/enoyl-CoA hydratase family protein [Deltaproteobacteria bacterium]|nr:MAG: crotonase/enoyl-CoA hydratase family protein [Deltaproteobacteria bacterium]